jgi:hypothetical protein
MIDGLTFCFCYIIYLNKSKGLHHTELDALRISITEIAFLSCPFPSGEVNISEGTDLHTDFAPKASALIDHYSIGSCVASKGFGRTDPEARWVFTLDTRKGGDKPLLRVEINPDV